MPSASTIHAAYEALRDNQAEVAEDTEMDTGLRKGAKLRAKRAGEAMEALGPMVCEEAERLAAEAQGYVDRSEAA